METDSALRMRSALRQACEKGLTPIALYGAGKHTAKVLPALLNSPVPIAGFVDDDPSRHGSNILGWEILSPEDAIRRGIKAVVLNSDASEEQMWSQRQRFERNGIAVLRLYGDAQSNGNGHVLREIQAAMDGVLPLSRSALHQYWSSRGGAGSDTSNALETYTRNVTWSLMLAEWLRAAGVAEEDPILELGCNIGRNLAVLRMQGFRRISAIEINPNSVEMMARIYPGTRAAVAIHQGCFEVVLPRMPDRSAAVVFTMAVLEHVHPDSEFIFDHMVRVSARYIVTIEDEVSNTPRHFRRDYGQVFGSRGCREVRTQDFSRMEPEQVQMLNLQTEFVARLFEVPHAAH